MILQEGITSSKVNKPQHGLQMVYNYSRCVGLWPFTITYNSKTSIMEARVNSFDRLWFTTSICLYLLALFCSYKNAFDTLSPNADHFVWHLLQSICEVPGIIFGVVGIVLDMRNRNILVNILKNIIVFDKRVGLQSRQSSMEWMISAMENNS